MIRLIQRRLIIPRGDTGTFTVPVLATKNTGDVAVFSIIDTMTDKKVFEKIVNVSGDTMTIEFSHYDTVNLPVGKYVWDIKFYQNPEFMDGVLVNGVEVDSYYAAFTMPICEIRQTGDNLLMADDAPGTELTPDQLDILNAAVNETNAAKNQANESAASANTAATTAADKADEATAKAEEATAKAEEATAALNELKEILPTLAEVATSGSYEDLEDKPFIPSRVSDLTDDSGHYTKPANGIPASDLEETYLTEHQDISGKANIADLATVATSGNYTDLENKPYIPVKTSDLINDSNYAVDGNYVHTDNNYTTAEKNKLSGIAAGAEVNVNADWNATSGDAQILNKPIKVSDFTNDVGYLTEHQDISGKADKSEIPTKVSQLQNDSGYLNSFTETDPTVPAWAKAAQKPSYTAAEVGAPTVAEMNTAIGTAIGQINSFDMAVVQTLPTQDISTHTIYLVSKIGETNDVYDEYIYINNAWEMVGNTQIDLSNYALKSELPTNVSELNNDSGYLTSYTEIDPTVPQWAKASTKPNYTAVEVGALPSDTHIPSTTAELTNDAGFITIEEVATLEETAEIINNYGMGDDDSMLVETEFMVGDGSNAIPEGAVYYETVMDASDIAAAYKAGKSVIFRLPASDEEYDIYDDIYMQLVGFEEGDGFNFTWEDLENAQNSGEKVPVLPVFPRFTCFTLADDKGANAIKCIVNQVCINNKVYFMTNQQSESSTTRLNKKVIL